MRIPSTRVAVGGNVCSARVHPVHASDDPGHASHAKVLELRQLIERDAERKREQEIVERLAAVLDAQIHTLDDGLAANLQQVAGIVVELGLTVAREIVGGAVDRGLVDPMPIVERCLEQAVVGTRPGAGPTMRVRMHPEDLSTWTRHTNPPAREISFDVGPELARGEVVVSTDIGQLHYDPREVCERLSDAIRTDGFGPLTAEDAAQVAGDEHAG